MKSKRPHFPPDDDPGPRSELEHNATECFEAPGLRMLAEVAGGLNANLIAPHRAAEPDDMPPQRTPLELLTSSTLRVRALAPVTTKDFDQLCNRFGKLTIHDEDVSSIKCTLSQFFIKDSIKQPQQRLIRDEIERGVRTLHQIRIEATHLANYHVLRCLASRKNTDPSTRLEFPSIDRNFFNRCVSGVGLHTQHVSGDVPLDDTIRMYRHERNLLPTYESPHINLWDHSKSQLSKAMLVNARNALLLEFYPRLTKYVSLRYNISARGLVHALIKEAFESWGPKRKIALGLHDWLEIQPSENNIKNNDAHFYTKLFDMLEYKESLQDKNPKLVGNRMYSLLPLSRSFVPSHIAIDSSVLLQIWARIRQQLGALGDDHDPFKRFLARRDDGSMRILHSTEFQRIRDDVWREHFNIDQFEDAGWMFKHYITTNGYDVSILRARPISGNENPFLSTRAFDPKLSSAFVATKIIGIDPGSRMLCTAASIASDEDANLSPRTKYRFFKKKQVSTTRTMRWRRKRAVQRRKRRRRRLIKRKMFGPVTLREFVRERKGEHVHHRTSLNMFTVIQVSTKEYRHIAGFNKARAWREGIKAREDDYANAIRSIPSFKTASAARFWERMPLLWANLNRLVEFSAIHAFRKWRFFSFVYKARAMSQIAARVVPVVSRSVFVGYGNWSNRGRVRGHPKSPVKGFMKYLSRRAVVRRIDEFRTSKRCYSCHADLCSTRFPMVENGVVVGITKSKSVLHCPTSTCNAHWDRDVNASLNIMHIASELLQSRPRPIYLRRN